MSQVSEKSLVEDLPCLAVEVDVVEHEEDIEGLVAVPMYHDDSPSRLRFHRGKLGVELALQNFLVVLLVVFLKYSMPLEVFVNIKGW